MPMLDFNDTSVAFADRSDRELQDKRRLFSMMSSPLLVALGTSAADAAFRFGLPVSGLIKATVFGQFCGGETIEECEGTIRRLGASGVGTILDFAPEGKDAEDEFERTAREVLRNIDRARADADIPFAVFKPTGVISFAILEKVSAEQALSADESRRWAAAIERVEAICRRAYEAGQPIFIDAEDYSIQKAVDELVERMMVQFNRETIIVYHTVQMYRTDRLDYLRDSYRRVREAGSLYGIKLVRGAYMERERLRASEAGYPSPIHATKEATDASYDAAVDFCVANLDGLAFVNATHNEASTHHLVQRMGELGIPPGHPRVFFSQLYGMSDNLSYVLAKAGYNVSKYVPYGPVKDAIPYLSRRAQENTSVLGQVGRELAFIEAEIARRSKSVR